MEAKGFCENCMFWLQTGAADEGMLGECRRRAPLPLLTDTTQDTRMRFTVWPTTLDRQFCGEFEERPMDSGELLKRMAEIEKMEAQRKKKNG